MRPILLLEINEVPWRVIDRYMSMQGFDSLRKFFERSHQLTSLAVDTGELSPWVTWPTLHRGMNNDAHDIRNLGQDPATFKGEPIWQVLLKRGMSVGVFGSMQSWPPVDPGNDGFFVPDTFAHDASCIPASLNAIQAFNLRMVQNNARVVSASLPSTSDLLKLPFDLVQHGLRLETAVQLALQLLSEKLKPGLVKRRPIFQTVLFWDIFCKLFNPHRPPALSTFFTNHVAGVMHRYWSDVFPEDFPEKGGRGDHQNRELMDFAMRQTNMLLARAMEWVDTNPDLIVVVASSMGQAAIKRSEHEGVELVVESVPALLSAAGLSRSEFMPLLAMVPQIAVEIQEASSRKRVADLLSSAACGMHRFINVQEIGCSLSITVSTPPKQAMQDGVFQIGNQTLKFRDAGIRLQPVEPGTAYHIPQGSLAVYHKEKLDFRLSGRDAIPADQIKQLLLDLIDNGPSILGLLKPGNAAIQS